MDIRVYWDKFIHSTIILIEDNTVISGVLLGFPAITIPLEWLYYFNNIYKYIGILNDKAH